MAYYDEVVEYNDSLRRAAQYREEQYRKMRKEYPFVVSVDGQPYERIQKMKDWCSENEVSFASMGGYDEFYFKTPEDASYFKLACW